MCGALTGVWSRAQVCGALHRCAEPRTGVWSRARVCGALTGVWSPAQVYGAEHRCMEPSTGMRGPACHLVSPQGPRNQAVLSYRGVGSCPTHPLFAGYSSELRGVTSGTPLSPALSRPPAPAPGSHGVWPSRLGLSPGLTFSSSVHTAARVTPRCTGRLPRAGSPSRRRTQGRVGACVHFSSV